MGLVLLSYYSFGGCCWSLSPLAPRYGDAKTATILLPTLELLWLQFLRTPVWLGGIAAVCFMGGLWSLCGSCLAQKRAALVFDAPRVQERLSNS